MYIIIQILTTNRQKPEKQNREKQVFFMRATHFLCNININKQNAPVKEKQDK